MTQEEWFADGLLRGWLQPICLMHDFDHVLTDEETKSYYEDGEDPCVPRYITKAI
jgi:hypothetical protein